MRGPLAIEHVAWSRPESERSGTLLVVALHGRGADEQSMALLFPHLPPAVTVAAPRAPIPSNGGFAWFDNRGIARPVEESITEVGAALFAWLDGVAVDHTGVVILGFSGGASMAGGLLLAQPTRFAGAVLLSGSLPWDAGYDTSPGRLSDVPLFWSIDEEDAVIPRELVVRSEQWLGTASGAALTVHRYPGIGHEISTVELADISAFVAALA